MFVAKIVAFELKKQLVLKKKSMPLYIWFLNRVILPVGDFFVSGSYLKNLKLWQTYDQCSESELVDIQNKKLKQILEHAIGHVPYYQNMDSNELTDFPILTKDILRAHASYLISDQHHIADLDKHHSSGSSGIQSFTYMTNEHTFYLRALQTHWWQWSGYRMGSQLLQFGISQKRSVVKRLKDFFYRCYYVKAFGLSKSDLEKVVKHMSSSKNLFIAGYPSVIQELAKESSASNLKFDVKGVICFGDKLFDHYERDIKNAFGNEVRIIDTYGCAEGLLMACKYDLDAYYIMSPHVYLEIVDDEGKPVKDGEIGNVLVTCLSNYAMPLIRYKLGDLAIKLPKEAYPKHRKLNYPLLQKVVGRETDVVKTTKGITLNVHSFTGVLEYYQTIKQFKVIQNDLESIIIEYIAEENELVDTPVLDEIKSKINALTHHCLEITFSRKEYIAPSGSGKPQIIESNLNHR